MDLTFTDEQELLAKSVRSFINRHWPTSTVRRVQELPDGFDPDLWSRVREQGWTAMAVPEQSGGHGADLVDLAVVAEELGRGAVSAPLFSTVSHGVLPVILGSDNRVRDAHLEALVGGDAIATGAIVEQAGRSQWPTVESDRTLTGAKVLVPYAAVADLIVVTARLRDGGPALLALPRSRAGISWRRHSLAVGDPLYRVEFTDVEIRDDDVIARGTHAVELQRRCEHVGAILSAVYTVGLCQSALDLAVDHAKNRVQFGKPIGAFQAVANRCVDMRVEIDALRLLALEAAWRIDRGEDAALAVHTAQAYTHLTARTVVTHSHQVLGAMGFSTEHDLYLYTRRAKVVDQITGSDTSHLHRVADRLGL